MRWYYRSVFDDLEEMRNYRESLFQQVYETSPTALLPPARDATTKMLPAQRAVFRIDISEDDDEIIVTADLVPGVTKHDITLTLINPQALEISCERNEEKKSGKEEFCHGEYSFGSMARFVPLPRGVTEHGSTASFINGVLEVHLRKLSKQAKGKITLE